MAVTLANKVRKLQDPIAIASKGRQTTYEPNGSELKTKARVR